MKSYKMVIYLLVNVFFGHPTIQFYLFDHLVKIKTPKESKIIELKKKILNNSRSTCVVNFRNHPWIAWAMRDPDSWAGPK